jgi:hypothetical protein
MAANTFIASTCAAMATAGSCCACANAQHEEARKSAKRDPQAADWHAVPWLCEASSVIGLSRAIPDSAKKICMRSPHLRCVFPVEKERLALRERVVGADLHAEPRCQSQRRHRMCSHRALGRFAELAPARDVGHEAVEVRLEMVLDPVAHGHRLTSQSTT